MGRRDLPHCDTSLYKLCTGTSLSVRAVNTRMQISQWSRSSVVGVAERGAIQWEGPMWISGKVRKREVMYYTLLISALVVCYCGSAQVFQWLPW
jgi:hypothetical protein